ncbi:MAG: alpha/beta fold hydrolase, partial [Sphingopyxis sp.]
DALSPHAPITLVGHDWGAAIVWNAALARPDRFGAVAALSIPWLGKAKRPFDDLFTERFTNKDRFFYQAYFQQPGVAEAELEADPARFLRAFYHCISGQAQPGDWPADKRASANLLDGLRFPDALPSFVDPAYFALAVEQFTRTGFAGALNRYRNHKRDFEWAQAFDGIIRQPALFIGGAMDPALVLGTADPLPMMRGVVPHLHAATLIDGCGHWMQAERGTIVSAMLCEWLGQLRAPPAA